jgi:transcriptional regulator with XRE-family HTH domain
MGGHWSRARLAKAAGVDEGTIQRLENDRKSMAKKPAQAVCNAGYRSRS